MVAQKMRTALLAIPGHAEYFEKQIKDLQTKLENAPKDEEWNFRVDYDDVQINGFQTLEQLPSPESVRVLGNFLADKKGGIDFAETGPNPSVDQIMAQQKKNCNFAAMALFKLIANPPMEDTGSFRPGVLEAWLDWHEEVKAGHRTFRFKDNPMEYDLNGPAPKEKLIRIERDRKRDEERATGHKKSASGLESSSAIAIAGKPLSIAAFPAACAMIGVLVWYFLRGRTVA